MPNSLSDPFLHDPIDRNDSDDHDSENALDDPLEDMRGDMREDLPAENFSLASEAIDALNIDVSFSVGTLTSSFMSMRNLQAGDILEICPPPGGQVALMLNGRAFAHGELVSIDGRIAVEIISTGAAQ